MCERSEVFRLDVLDVLDVDQDVGRQKDRTEKAAFGLLG